MKPILTFLCALCFGVVGISLAITSNNNRILSNKQNTISASTVPNIQLPKLPLDLQLDLEKKYIKTDTVYIPQELVVVGKTESKSLTNRHKSKHALANAATSRQSLRSPACEPDTVVKNQACGVREEYTPDTIGPPKESIILVVDGEEVYKR